jgi:hypothetical protein
MSTKHIGTISLISAIMYSSRSTHKSKEIRKIKHIPCSWPHWQFGTNAPMQCRAMPMITCIQSKYMVLWVDVFQTTLWEFWASENFISPSVGVPCMSTIVAKALTNQPFGRENKKLTENKNGTTDANTLSVLVGISSGLFLRNGISSRLFSRNGISSLCRSCQGNEYSMRC